MASILDTSLLQYFSVIFPALLVFVIVYGIMQHFKILGESKSIHSIISLAAAFLVMLSSDIIALIGFIAPWFVFVFIFVVLLLTVYRMMGASESDISRVINKDETIGWVIFVVGLIIIGAGAANVFGSRLMPLTQAENATDTGDFSSQVGLILFHPKVLGLIFIGLVSVFSIALLTKAKV